MFAHNSAIFGLLLFASTLPNGIRLVELPGQGDSVQIVAGYTAGKLSGLGSTRAAKALLVDAYAAGGSIDFVSELDRTALRLTIPVWALPKVLDQLPALFREVPASAEKENRRSSPSIPDFLAKVEEEIRSALLGANESAPANYATDTAFVLVSAPVPPSLRDALAAIPKRTSTDKPDDRTGRLAAERTLRFKSDQPTGGVIFASPISSVYYKQWYQVLLLDRVIHRAVRLPLKTTLPLTVDPYYYRMEMPIPPGQFPEPAEENLLQEIQRLQFTRAEPLVLSAARGEAVSYLNSSEVREWFASRDLSDRRDEGVQWLESMTADDLRVAARDLLIMNRVIASWAPKPAQTAVAVEDLRVGDKGKVESNPSRERNTGEVDNSPIHRGSDPISSSSPFPLHTDSAPSTPLPERLASNVSLVTSNVNAVFVSGGPLTRFDHDLTSQDVQQFQKYRPERILVLAPPASMDRARQLWSGFKGTSNGEIGVPKGNVSSGDLTALFVLKTIVDLQIIEAGWWSEAALRIDASDGSTLQIRADEEKRAQILTWIKDIALALPDDDYFAWVREAAIHRFETVRADLQALTWERDPQGTIPGLETISAKHVKDVAAIYF